MYSILHRTQNTERSCECPGRRRRPVPAHLLGPAAVPRVCPFSAESAGQHLPLSNREAPASPACLGEPRIVARPSWKQTAASCKDECLAVFSPGLDCPCFHRGPCHSCSGDVVWENWESRSYRASRLGRKPSARCPLKPMARLCAPSMPSIHTYSRGKGFWLLISNTGHFPASQPCGMVPAAVQPLSPAPPGAGRADRS